MHQRFMTIAGFSSLAKELAGQTLHLRTLTPSLAILR